MKGRPLIFHFLFWAAIYLLWIAIFRSYSYPLTKTITIEFCYLIFITVDYYLINDLIVPKFLFNRKYGIFIISTLATVCLSAWGRSVVALNMNLHFFHSPGNIDFPDLYFHSLINISLWVFLITIARMMVERLQTQQKLEMLEKERVKNELDYLKAQMNPHALFNSLNTIYGHIEKNNQLARNSLLQFSELLRYQLYDCSGEKVNLEKEIEYLNHFTTFHRLRKNEGLIVNLQIDQIEPGLQIAPLLLVVLVENAFKFVSNFSESENKICIRIFTKDGVLHSFFSNTKECVLPGAVNKSSGIGVANLKRRLALLYPGKHEFNIRTEDYLYETILNIDLT